MKTGTEMAPMLEKKKPTPPYDVPEEITKGVISKEEFERQIPELTLYLRNYMGKKHLAFFKYEQNSQAIMEDLIQETLLKAVLSLSGFNGKANLKTWVMRIFINNLNDYFRKKQIDPLENLEPLAENEDSAKNLEKLIQGTRQSVTNPEKLLLEREKEELQRQQKEKLDEAISTLPEVERAVLKLYLEKLQVKQIANQVGTTEDAVKNHLFRARRHLESKFGVSLPKGLRINAKKT